MVALTIEEVLLFTAALIVRVWPAVQVATYCCWTVEYAMLLLTQKVVGEFPGWLLPT